MIKSLLRKRFIRFGIVAVLGLIIDLLTTLFLTSTAGLALPFAAVFGFALAAVTNYLMHEFWTFRDGVEQRSSRARALGYFGVLAITLLLRVTAIVLLQLIFVSGDYNIAIWAFAVGVSFLGNYILSTRFVFRPTVSRGETNQVETAQIDWQVPEYEAQVLSARRSDFVLVIPVINEGDRIQTQLIRIHDLALGIDVIIADGGSTDGSIDASFVSTNGVRAVLKKTGPGRLSAQLRMAYSWALREGYEGIVTVDGNGKDGVDAIPRFVELLAKGYGYIQGSRYKKGGLAENTPFERTIGNRLVHAPLLSMSGRRWFTDTTNGFRGYSRGYLLDPKVAPFRDVFVEYELLFYLTVRAGQLGYRVCETPVRRSYPESGPTPTKINNSGAKFQLLLQTIKASIGAYNPHN